MRLSWLGVAAFSLAACEGNEQSVGPSARLRSECSGGAISQGGGLIDETLEPDRNFPFGADASLPVATNPNPPRGTGEGCPCVYYRSERVLRLAFLRAGTTPARIQLVVPDFGPSPGLYRVGDLHAVGVVTASDGGSAGQRVLQETPPATCDLSADAITPGIQPSFPCASPSGSFFSLQGRLQCAGLVDAGVRCFGTNATFSIACLER